MKRPREIWGHSSPPRIITAAFLMASCGAELKPEDRLAHLSSSSNLETSHTFIDSEDVVSILLAPEKVANQTFTQKEQDDRERSLIPAGKFSREQQSLLINSVELGLAAAGEDAREETDLRSFDTPIRNQGSRPWCTAFATIGAIENLARRFFDQSLDLSEIHHFKSYGVYQTAPSLNAAKTIGLIDESLWPYYGNKQQGSDSKIRAKLQGSRKIQLSLTDVVQSIREGQPLVINLDVNGSFMNPKQGGIIVPGGYSRGGHAIALTGVVLDNRVGGGGYFIIKNSWGQTWGDNGYGYIPFSYCNYSYCSAWSISDVEVRDDDGRLRDKKPGILPLPAPTPKPDVQPKPVEPAPLDDSINSESFKLITQLKDYRGLFGSYFYTLTLSGSAGDLNQISSVIYQVDGYRNFTSLATDSASTVLSRDIASRSYKIWPGQIDHAAATVQLKNGRQLQIRGIDVDF